MRFGIGIIRDENKAKAFDSIQRMMDEYDQAIAVLDIMEKVYTIPDAEKAAIKQRTATAMAESTLRHIKMILLAVKE